MNAKRIKGIALIVTLSLLTSCAGSGHPFETRVYGVPESQWSTYTTLRKELAITAYMIRNKPPSYTEEQLKDDIQMEIRAAADRAAADRAAAIAAAADRAAADRAATAGAAADTLAAIAAADRAAAATDTAAAIAAAIAAADRAATAGAAADTAAAIAAADRAAADTAAADTAAADTAAAATDTAAQDIEYSLGVALQKSNSKSSAMFTQGPWGTQLPITTANLNVPGVSVFGGARISKNFAVEAGVSFAKKATEVNDRNNTVTVTSSNLYMDAVGVMPINKEVELLVKAGFGRMNANISVDNESIINESDVNKTNIGVRLGIGAQYAVYDNLYTRAMFTHQKGNTDGIRSANTMELGVSFGF